MQTQELTGLERLKNFCQRLNLGWVTSPPASHPPQASSLIAGRPLDPYLAAVYQRVGEVTFALELEGVALYRWSDTVDELERFNQSFQEYTQPGLGLPVFEFAREANLAYGYATVPSLADERGYQPVVMVDPYEEPCALPVASDVDTFFSTYASFLEALVSHPDHDGPWGPPFVFPWGVPEILARDERLVALLRAGKFQPVMEQESSTLNWVARILEAAQPH